MAKTKTSLASKLSIGSAGLLSTAIVGALVGAFGGAAGYTAHYASATSYLSEDPKACINCHIMNDQYNSWSSSSHHARATCNDCHVPHDSLVSKFYVKAEHGYRHSKRFTFQNFHEPIQINQASYDVVIDNCVRCHEEMTHDIRLATHANVIDKSGISGGLNCIHCHASVAHGPTR
ncbi:MAG: cytochrome c nitrite reductase small subunit [Pyrinomonadaceae bacterium]|nr:cytochrome c nitrite reductase small subunit [Phycisphaerales bacterium]